MSTADPLAPLRPHVRNALPAVSVVWVAGVLGDHPSLYSRSPAMWNAAFAALNLRAVYVPFDVPPDHVGAFLAACRTASDLLGFNITVPYKERVLAHLDALDPATEAIGAVNTVIRTREGRLIGANTDGSAALRAMQRVGGGASGREIATRLLLLLGAGGAARAVGVAVAQEMAGTAILLCGRRPERADDAAHAIRRAGGEVTVVHRDELDDVLPVVGMVLNASSVGMAGPIQTESGLTWLEPFSPLAPADPPILPAEMSREVAPLAAWWPAAWPGIVRNLEVSLRRALRLHAGAPVLDLIYAPPESVLLKHARWTGHAVMNGEAVLITQAVEAFMWLCAAIVEQRHLVTARKLVEQAMTKALR